MNFQRYDPLQKLLKTTDLPGPQVTGGTVTTTVTTVAPTVVSQIQTFSRSGELSVSSGTFKLVFPFDVVVFSVRATCGVAPTGAAVIVDVHKDGTTIFTTQANRPTIVDGTTISNAEIPDVTAVTAGEALTVDIDQIGSTTPGEDLSVILEWRIAP